jgi:hypothetical protein
LHEKIVELQSRIISLEADLKVHIPTSYSTCELHVVKNLELAQCVGHLQDENNKLCEVLSWLSSQEPQLGMMIGCYKRFDGWALGSDKFGESSGEREGNFGNIPVPPKPTPKDKFAPKPNKLLKPRENPSEKACKKPSLKPCEEPHPNHEPKPIRFHCEFCGKDGHKREFCYKRKREVRWLRCGRTRIGTTLLMVCLSLVCHYLRERALCIRFCHGEIGALVAEVVVWRGQSDRPG